MKYLRFYCAHHKYCENPDLKLWKFQSQCLFFFLLCVRVYVCEIGWILQRKGWELMGWMTCFLCQKKIKKEERDNVGICSVKLPQIEYKERKKFYGKISLTTAEAEHPYP